MNGYKRIEQRFSQKNINFVAYSKTQVENIATGRSDKFDVPNDHHISGILGEKCFSIKMYDHFKEKNRKEKNRILESFRKMNGKAFRKSLAKSLTASGYGLVKPENIRVVEPFKK